MELIDLTLKITSNMPVPPANQKTLPPVDFTLFKEAARDGIQVGFFQSGIHAGTHLDAPRHVIADGKTIDELPLETFCGKAYCIDVSGVEQGGAVTAAMLEHAHDKITPGMMVFLYTGWSDKHFYEDNYWEDSPYLAEDAAEWLVAVGSKIAGYDFFQERAAKSTTPKPADFAVHHILLSNNVLNIEHLCNLGRVKEQTFEVVAFPLKIVGAEGSPTRVVAFK